MRYTKSESYQTISDMLQKMNETIFDYNGNQEVWLTGTCMLVIQYQMRNKTNITRQYVAVIEPVIY